ncbi:MAG: putative manganese transporter [Verrucomicrobiota bacterium]
MEIITETLIDTGKLVPFLAAIYFVVGFLEYRYGDRISHVLRDLGTLGPVMGALLGCIPQCGFSVVASALYVKRVISVGTLLAVFLSTSDEAVPVLLSMPDKAKVVGVLIAIKVVIAIAAGVGVDYVIRVCRASKPKEATADVSGVVVVKEHAGCCDHGLDGRPSKVQALLLHPLRHIAKIFGFLLLLTLVLNFLVERIGPDKIGAVLLQGSIFQPVLASLIGLVPNCFASVLLAELYAKGSISFGALVAGLCAGGGIGILVLIKENKDFKDTVFLIGLLLTVSIVSGIVIDLTGIF